MNKIFQKLNLKNQKNILIVNRPQSFDKILKEFDEGIKVQLNFRGVKLIDFALFFVTKKIEIDEIANKIEKKLNGDATVWFAYPKGTSKNYKCDFNRDTGWESLGKIGLEGVRMVAIDEDWSALRFRRVEYIKKMTRRKDFAMTEKGKQKTKGK